MVILDLPRCSGAAHGGCQRACTLFWKTAWLRKVPAGEQPRAETLPLDVLRASTRTMSGPTRYFCQSTELQNATRPLTRQQVVLKCFSDLRSGSRGFFEMVRFVLVPIWRYFVFHKIAKPLTVGELKRTPVFHLSLQPGDVVRIKPEEEIVKTLDGKARNRGLSCDRGMRQFCGGEYRVRNRLDRMISETTGEMRDVEATVILEGLNCLCWWNHVGGCPREDYMYWREAWLDRAQPVQTNAARS